jgi:hypothetical protein
MAGAGLLLAVTLVALALSTQQAQAVGIATYLQGNPDYTVAAKFVQLADAPAIFGDSPEAGIVLFAASDSAWKTAADALGINIDPSTASKADGEKLGSIMMYNMISGAGTDAHEEGTPESLAAKQDVQTLLGAANSQQLPLHFTRKGDQTVATGLVPDNNAVLPEPLKLGKSLVYLTDTVLLPSSEGAAVPNPARRRR